MALRSKTSFPPKSRISQISTDDHTDVLMEILNKNFVESNEAASKNGDADSKFDEFQRKSSKAAC